MARAGSDGGRRRRLGPRRKRPDWSLGDPALGLPSADGTGHPGFARVDERELVARREDLLDYVRGSFNKGALADADLEDAVQSAWAEVLDRQGDEPIRDLRAFMAEVAWRTANNMLRRPRPTPLDPDDPKLVEREDPDSSLADRVGERAEVARAVEALEQLDESERQAFSLWFSEELATEEACERLGIRRSAYFKRLRAAKEHVERAMACESHLFDRRQRRLLSDYVAGIADGRARARAERLIAADPQAAALARELRRAHEAAALALPLLGLASVGEAGAAERLAALIAKAQDAILGLLGRNPQAGELAGSAALGSAGARGAGVAGAGLVAKAVGGLGVGNVVLGCLGGGAVATVACVAAGVISLPNAGGQGDHDRRPRPERQAGPPKRARHPVAPDVISRPSAASASETSAAKPPREKSPPTQAVDSEPVSEPAPAPAPAPQPTLEPSTPPEVQEFGVAAAGVPASGAPPDTNDADGAAASASTVRKEFGP